MGPQRKGPTLEPVLEDYIGPSITIQHSVRYKAHKDSTEGREDASAGAQCMCVKPLSFFGKLRDRYIKAMNEMAMGGDFTAMAGYHGTLGSQECRYTMELCRSVTERQQEALQEELAALSRSRSQHHHPSFILREAKV